MQSRGCFVRVALVAIVCAAGVLSGCSARPDSVATDRAVRDAWDLQCADKAIVADVKVTNMVPVSGASPAVYTFDVDAHVLLTESCLGSAGVMFRKGAKIPFHANQVRLAACEAGGQSGWRIEGVKTAPCRLGLR